jgi:hypothetical protein
MGVMSEHDPTDFLDEEVRETEAQAAAEQAIRWEVSDWRWLMGSKRGRRVVWRLLTNAGVYRLSYQPGDALGTAFQEGNRNQGQRILALIMEHASEAYALMVQERTNVRS